MTRAVVDMGTHRANEWSLKEGRHFGVKGSKAGTWNDSSGDPSSKVWLFILKGSWLLAQGPHCECLLKCMPPTCGLEEAQS